METAGRGESARQQRARFQRAMKQVASTRARRAHRRAAPMKQHISAPLYGGAQRSGSID